MKELNIKLQQQFNQMCATGKLFRVDLSGDDVWEVYLKSFLPEHDPVFRDPESTEHNCNHCKNFIRRYGNVVSIVNNEIISMFDIDPSDEYFKSMRAMNNAITKSKVVNVFFETFQELKSLPYESCSKSNEVFRLGVAQNHKRYTKEEAEKFGVVKPNEIRTFDHFHLDLPKAFVDFSGKSVESIMGDFRDAKNVFQRAMESISLDTLHLVKDLIKQGSLLDGTTHLFKIDQIIPLKTEYDKLSANKRDNWCWVNSYRLPFAKFRNELIGVLCSELSEGKELNAACLSWNKRVDPKNYMKATAPITEKQIKEAQKFVEEHGYMESFNRRFATLKDINVTEILHTNSGDGKIKTVSIFDSVKAAPSTRHKRSEFDKVETVPIDKFMEDILPSCTSVEVFLTNAHENNMVSLTTADDLNAKKIFKWPNNFSWTFNGNLAGKSQIKEEVKTKGGKVDGVFRFSMMWADGNGDNSDLDLHCIEPDRNEIYFSNTRSQKTGGNLDIDIRHPGGRLAVENITYPSLSRMLDGDYKLFIRQFAARGSKGFAAEIEFDGEIYSYVYDRPLTQNQDIQIAVVTLKNGKFTIQHKLPANGNSIGREIYNLSTNEFHRVNLMCLSPNHWNEKPVGNKHYFFMLENCKTPSPIRSFHNENLIPELAEHRKVLEVLGETNVIQPAEKQLSGLGFNSTVNDELIVKLSGSHKRIVKIIF